MTLCHRSFLSIFDRLAKESGNARTKDKKKWWERRQELNDELEKLLRDIESAWFGSTDRELLRPGSAALSRAALLELLKMAVVEAGPKTSVEWARLREEVDVEGLMLARPDAADSFLKKKGGAGAKLTKTECARIARLFCKAVKDAQEASVAERHLVLVLGTGLEKIPWESLPVLRGTSVWRMPSLGFLEQTVEERVVDAQKGYFVLNPSSDLKNTQSAFSDVFRKKGWQGLAGVPPTPEQFLEALQRYDLFVYCGHNSGEQYLRREAMERRLETVRPVALLMGCSSAALKDLGSYEPSGVVQSYVQAKCPAVAGNLFDVTDADIDRFLLALLDKWLARREGNLGQCVAEAREACKMPFLVGASPVLYGLPTVRLASMMEDDEQGRRTSEQ